MRSRPFIGWLCALLLVLAQHAAWAHGLSHLNPNAGGDDPTLPLHGKVCEQCHQASQLGAALAPSLVVFAGVTPYLEPAPGRETVYQAVTTTPYSSRAPPSVS